MSNQPMEPDANPEPLQASTEDESNQLEMSCSQCSKELVFDLMKLPDHFPFCSMRCKTIDLGGWLSDDAEDEAEGLDQQSEDS